MKQITFVLDETGSMAGNRDETITTFNEYLDDVGKEKGVRFTLFSFNSNATKERCRRVKVKDVPRLDTNNYQPAYTTPLLDAIGAAITSAETSSGKRDKVMVVILTDGFENASKEYTAAAIRELIKQKEEAGWAFLFLGADLDARGMADKFGIDQSRTMSYGKGLSETRATMQTLGVKATAYFASGNAADASFDAGDRERSGEAKVRARKRTA